MPDLPRGWFGPPWAAPRPRSITELIRDGVLDAELAALLWLLVEARVPIVVAAGPSGVGKSTLLAALLDFLPDEVRRRAVHGIGEDFAWLPEAGRLGWVSRSADPAVPAVDAADRSAATAADPADAPIRSADPADTVLLVPELSGHLPWYTWGAAARVVVRATSLGYGLAATIHADSLEGVVATLTMPPVSLTADEVSHLGVVLILRAVAGTSGAEAGGDVRAEGPRRRVVAAHWVRPVARDAGGHVQRLGPAVLATWDSDRDAFEHFAWGVLPELAIRIGRKAGDLEAEQAERAALLGRLASTGVTDPRTVRQAVAARRLEQRAR